MRIITNQGHVKREGDLWMTSTASVDSTNPPVKVEWPFRGVLKWNKQDKPLYSAGPRHWMCAAAQEEGSTVGWGSFLEPGAMPKGCSRERSVSKIPINVGKLVPEANVGGAQ